MVAEEEAALQELYRQPTDYDEELVARRNSEVMGIIDASLGIG